MKNSELLENVAPNALLSPLDQQKRFVLRQASMRLPCPNCGTLQNQFEAAGVSVDDWNFYQNRTRKDESGKEETIGGSNGYVFHCVGCKRQLQEAVPLFVTGIAKWNWLLIPIPVEK
jgi:hypothetical protein